MARKTFSVELTVPGVNNYSNTIVWVDSRRDT